MYRPNNKRGYDAMRGHRDNYRERQTVDTERALMKEREDRHKMADELQRREQQLVMTSTLLHKQSMMLKNLETNMMVQTAMNQHPSILGVRGVVGGGVGGVTPQFHHPVAQARIDPPASKRLKESQRRPERRENQDRGQSSGSVNLRRSNRRYRNIEKKMCFLCRLKGHFARDCPNTKEGETSSSSTTRHDSNTGEISQKTSTKKSPKPSTMSSASKDLKKFCNLCLKNVDMNIHLTDPEHVKKSNCKVCGKSFNTAENYMGHNNSSLHKALINKRKQMIDAKLKPFSSDKITGSEYVVPVTGFFCKLCKKFYNKEHHAKVDHCKTKAHYDQVANLLCTKYEAAIYAKFKEIAEKMKDDRSGNNQRELLEAVRKADFITGLKYIKNTENKTDRTTKSEKVGKQEERRKKGKDGDQRKDDARDRNQRKGDGDQRKDDARDEDERKGDGDQRKDDAKDGNQRKGDGDQRTDDAKDEGVIGKDAIKDEVKDEVKDIIKDEHAIKEEEEMDIIKNEDAIKEEEMDIIKEEDCMKKDANNDESIEKDVNIDEGLVERDATNNEDMEEKDEAKEENDAINEGKEEKDAIKDENDARKDKKDAMKNDEEEEEKDAIKDEEEKDAITDEDKKKEQEEDEELMEHPDDLDMEVLDSVEDDV